MFVLAEFARTCVCVWVCVRVHVCVCVVCMYHTCYNVFLACKSLSYPKSRFMLLLLVKMCLSLSDLI